MLNRVQNESFREEIFEVKNSQNFSAGNRKICLIDIK